jgi:hypothetical protein
MDHGLSDEQKHILVRVGRHITACLEEAKRCKAAGESDRAHFWRTTYFWGAPWKGVIRRDRCDIAVLSQALKQLEDQGLVLRQNMRSGCPTTGGLRKSAKDPHTRTTHVALTPRGWDVYKRLRDEGEPTTAPATGQAAAAGE